MIPYGRQTIDAKDRAAVLKVLRSAWVTQGPNIPAFEASLCRYTGAAYAVAVSSGTAALHLACLAAGLKKGDEAITSPVTFLATANAVVYAGARPVFVDVEQRTGNIDPVAAAKAVTSKTKAILPVHFGGLPCDMDAIAALARKNKLIVIEDACHALGASYVSRGKRWKVGACRHSDMAVFSFHPVKSITTAEGGAILTNDKTFYKKLLLLRNHGMTKDTADFVNRHPQDIGPWSYEMQELGFNYRITDIQCALGASQMKKLDGFIARRRRIAATYDRAFRGNPYFDIPLLAEGNAWHLYFLQLKDRLKDRRKEIFIRLREQGIGVQVHYIPVHLQPFYTRMGFRRGLCPRAENFYRREISIPLYPALSEKNVNEVIRVVERTMKAYSR